MKKNNFLFIALILTLNLCGQNKTVDSLQIDNNTKFKYKSLIIPTVLIGYGIIGLESHTLKGINSDIKNEFIEHIDKKFTIDDISQYAPFLSVYALNTTGIKGKNNFKDRTIIFGIAYIIMGATVNVIKNTGNVQRPDGTSNNSFPSGHTATAFMGAEFLFQEYKEESIWYGISGYAVAAGTGFFRMYNERHWLTDVAAGAGIGILSTKIAYWIHPWMKRNIFSGNKKVNGVIMPIYNGKNLGIGMSMSF
jgi:membrane-associated phospholipid phosphatase